MNKTKIRYRAKHFSVIEKTIETRGKTLVKEFIKRSPVVIIAVLSAKNEVYLVSQYRNALEKQTLELAAGTLNEGEDPLMGAKRELSEETGITAQDWKHLATMQMSANMEAKVDVYLARDIQEGMPHQEEDEDIVLIKMPLQEAVKKAIAGEINIALHIATIFLLDKLQRDGKI